MRVTLVISSLQAGGAERVMSVLANELAERHVVSLVKLSAYEDHYSLDPRIEVMTVVPQGRSRLVRASIDKLRILGALRREIVELRPDVVVSFIDFTNVQTLLATRRLGVAVVVSERVDPRAHRIKASHRILRRIAYRWADSLVVQTHSVAEWAKSLLPADRVAVLPNPLAFEPIEATAGDHLDEVVLGVGRLVEQKGFDVLISAFGALADRHPSWRLRIVGEGPMRASLEQQIDGLGLADRVELPGVKPDVKDEYRTAGVFVLSSRYEGFPNVLLEAMAAGTACIATDCPSGPAEIAGPDESVMLVPVASATALAEAMESLIVDRFARARQGELATDRSRDFSTENVVRRWEELLETVTR